MKIPQKDKHPQLFYLPTSTGNSSSGFFPPPPPPAFLAPPSGFFSFLAAFFPPSFCSLGASFFWEGCCGAGVAAEESPVCERKCLVGDSGLSRAGKAIPTFARCGDGDLGDAGRLLGADELVLPQVDVLPQGVVLLPQALDLGLVVHGRGDLKESTWHLLKHAA